VSKERQRRRAEREAAAAAAAAVRAAEAEKRARRQARRDRLTGWLPRRTGQSGILAERRRKQVLVTGLLLVVLNLVFFALAPHLTPLLLVASVLGAPIVHMMIFRKA
jgi:Flp pilus assembly protein TadB